MATARTITRWPGVGQTAGVGTADLVTYVLAINTSVIIQGYAVGKDSSGNTVTIALVGGAKRAGGGSALVGAIVTQLNVADAAVVGATVILVASGNNIILQAAGVVLVNIDWLAEIICWEN